MPGNRPLDVQLSRRRVLQWGAGAALLGLTGACARTDDTEAPIGPDSPEVRAFAEAESRRFPGGRPVAYELSATQSDVDLAGKRTAAWLYNTQLPGPILRANVGDRVQVRFRNQLPDSTTVHWHGLAIRNDMDGVPDVTQAPIPADTEFVYDFIPPDPGTYWYHTHGDLQRGRGLYGALIIDDPGAPANYDAEFVVVLSDWLTDRTPSQVFDELRGGRMTSMPEMTSRVLGGDSGDVRYPVYLLNGKPPGDPAVFTARPGQRARIRLINAGDDTAFRVALGGHRLTVTDTDGFPVEPVDTDSVLIGMGERYDAVVTLQDGVFPLVAVAEGKGAQAFAVVRTGGGAAPDPAVAPRELGAPPLTVADLRATDAVRLPVVDPGVTLEASLGGDMKQYVWTVNGKAYPAHTPLTVHRDQRVRLVYTNPTMMFHPMHLHGHTFAVARSDGSGPRKDTVIVLPGQTVAADVDTTNPGQWITHCHNDYHLAAGMATIFSYVS
ncbi:MULTISPECIES: multicopper oxidase family protein [unclassified Rhodococcus (in: high G+C Gram-positive bacteria)]|uniref:multicopper oxidase family protein n=1 Tax=unclassified Rhodococcus (in: high G+C Gram-positive bacteria) TaxID=192944 RepID=UPI0024B66190|nr:MULTISPECIES: multicopper oxidase family protein [unclassified Rhodococcus (in: high G+C Gram-positive bacteria)]MDI9952475.1 multicopper oxidase family protein [Rhodococcus sp. IEGM 1305]MDI9976618.1 multicopper oxidase family protein [Rhodococcus sp. IEGM 1307]